MDKSEAKAIIKSVEDALKAGGKPPGEPTSSHERKAVAMAAEAIGIHRATVARRIAEAKKEYGIEPNWSLWEKGEEVPSSQRDTIRLRDENNRLRRQLNEAHRDAAGWEDIREAVLGLTATPLDARIEFPKPPSGVGSRTVIIHLSDLHCGEVVNIEDMGGLNRFNIEIFKARLGRIARSAVSLMSEHWSGAAPERIVVILGGDLVNGDHRLESAKTNDVFMAPGVRVCATHIAGVIRELNKIAPVDVLSVPGNHGRDSIMIEAKNFARHSFDTLVSSLVEMILHDIPTIRFFAPMSGDAILRIYGISFAVIHGQREIRGGQGFVGPFAAILRGWQKTLAYFAAQGEKVDMVISGHMHTAGFIPAFGIANGSLVGPNEYSRDLRAKPEPASQNMITVHSELGVIDVKQLFCGDPSEGRIYGTVRRKGKMPEPVVLG
jgi:Calcineurin-like phosphoesterase